MMPRCGHRSFDPDVGCEQRLCGAGPENEGGYG